MANNFFLNQDPLLLQNSYPSNFGDDAGFKKQMNDAMLQYKMLQQQRQSVDLGATDYIGNLDSLMKTLSGGGCFTGEC